MSYLISFISVYYFCVDSNYYLGFILLSWITSIVTYARWISLAKFHFCYFKMLICILLKIFFWKLNSQFFNTFENLSFPSLIFIASNGKSIVNLIEFPFNVSHFLPLLLRIFLCLWLPTLFAVIICQCLCFHPSWSLTCFFDIECF